MNVRLLAVVLFALAWCADAYALNPALDASQYVHTSWKIRDGFIRSTIRAITQTDDGYLWLGTDMGLLRFDGVTVRPWQPPANQALPSNAILSLLAARDGTLWIATTQGLASWKDGRLVRYESLAGSYIFRLAEDREGSIWITRFAASWMLCGIQGTRVTCHGEDGGPGAGALGLYADGGGNLWVGTSNGVWRWKPGLPAFYRLADQVDGNRGLSEDGDGALLIARPGGLSRFAKGRLEMVHRFPPSLQKIGASMLLRDRDGGLWGGTPSHGLVHVHEGIADTFARRDGLSGDAVSAIFEDREGTIWVATGDGLDRFRDSTVVSYSLNQGLSNDRAASVLASSDGSVWVGTSDGLNRWTNGRVSVYRDPRASAATTVTPPGTRDVGKVDIVGLPANIHSMFEDSQRRMWLSTAGAVGYVEDNHFVAVNGIPGAVTRAILEDSRKRLWIANLDHGLFGLVRGSPDLEQIPWTVTQRKDLVSALAADPSGEGLWLGFFRGGIGYLVGKEMRASYAASHGLATGRISWLYVDHAGALWVGADGGLSRLHDGRVSTLTSSNGLPCDAVGWVIEDTSRSLWLGMACGLVRIARTDIDAWAAAAERGRRAENGTPSRVEAAVFDHADGVRTFVNASYYSAPVVRSADGKLWFVSQDGVSVVDPANLPLNAVPAPVHIEQIVADRHTYAIQNAGTPVRLPPLVRDLQIDYTALSLAVPERVRFRYRLDGQDRDWQDVGTRRQAFYTDLRPGTYRFRVTASNNSGVWNDTGAVVDFSIAPAYYQTNWFLALSVAMFLAVVWAAHRVRLRVVERHQREITALNERMMKAQEQERIRIAGELHDGVMQQMLAATMMLGMAKRRVAEDSDAKATIDKVQQKLIQAGTDIRQLSHDLHPPALQDAGLPQAVTAYCEEFSGTCGIRISCDAAESTEALSRGAALALFRILQEALGNAAKHARATRIAVVLDRRDDVVSLEVSDNGAGFDGTRLGTSGGLGLIMMRERASQLNGTFTFASALGRGTTISVVIPFR